MTDDLHGTGLRGDGPGGPPPKTFDLVTTAQVERTYVVQAKTEEQAKDRLHIHLKDPDALAPGVVAEQGERQIDATPQRIKPKKSKPVAATPPA